MPLHKEQTGKITHVLNCELAGRALRTKFREWNRNILTIAKNYYAFSYEIPGNKFALAFAYSTEKKKKREQERASCPLEDL